MEVRIEAYPHLAKYAKDVKAGAEEQVDKLVKGDEETGTEMTTTGGEGAGMYLKVLLTYTFTSFLPYLNLHSHHDPRKLRVGTLMERKSPRATGRHRC